MIQKRILVVDDDLLVAWSIARVLSSPECCVQVVHRGEEARREISRAHFNLILLDVHLPDANGLELLRTIRAMDPAPEVIILSGDATEGNRERAVRGGAFRFVEKPFQLSDVERAVISALALR